MNILDTIISEKRKEVVERMSSIPLEALMQQPFYQRTPLSITKKLVEPGASGIIAEFKRKSPSKGIINGHADPVEVTSSYEKAGASAVSILTDQLFFGGTTEDLIRSRASLSIPILRKDFVIDPYQIHEAKAMGADLILLIAACLEKPLIEEFSSVAHSLGLEVLLELHDEEELEMVSSAVDLVGINNRSLKTFDVNIERSLKMARQLPDDKPRIAESGIDDPAQVRLFRANGYSGFLIGENFMKTQDPGMSLQAFVPQTY